MGMLTRTRQPDTLSRQSAWWRRGLVLLLVLLLVLAAWKGWRASVLAQRLYTDLQQAQTLASQQPDAAALDTLGDVLSRTSSNATALYHETRLVLPLLAALQWVPTYGNDLAAADELLQTGSAMSVAVDELFQAYAPLVPAREQLQAMQVEPEHLAHFSAARPHLLQARAAMDQALLAWERVESEQLSPRLREQVQRIEPLVPLLDAGIDLAIASNDLAIELGPLFLVGNDTPGLSTVVMELAQARPAIERARAAVEHAHSRLIHLPSHRLPGALRPRVLQLQAALPLARDGLDLAWIGPDLLGAHERRSYLLLNQNPDELRATGGFIGSAGPLIFENGSLVSADVTATDLPTNLDPRDYPDPPAPLRQYMNFGILVFRDANWSPDFPTAAQTILPLYELERGQALDHVIAIDPTAVKLLLQALGPVHVEDTAEPVSADNVLAYMREQYNLGTASEDVQKKAFVSRLLNAIIDRIEARATDIHMPTAITALTRALDERHILLYVADPDIAAFLAERRWDGAVRPGTQDFLMVVGSNIGYNKANPSVRQEIRYHVDLRSSGAPTAELAVYHRHLLDLEGPCRHWAGSEKAYPWDTYEGSFVDCYWDYMRVLVPADSRSFSWDTQAIPGAFLTDGQGPDDPALFLPAQEQLEGTYTLGMPLLVPFGEARTSRLRYQLPASVVAPNGEAWHYRLKIQQQPGREPPYTIVRLYLPDDATLISLSHAPAMRSGQTLFFAFDGAQDYTIDVLFQSAQYQEHS